MSFDRKFDTAVNGKILAKGKFHSYGNAFLMYLVILKRKVRSTETKKLKTLSKSKL